MDERQELDTMNDAELVAYWNILQAPCLKVDPDGKNERHKPIVSELLTERGIPHEDGKRTELAPEGGMGNTPSESEIGHDPSLDELIYDGEQSLRPR